MFFFLKKNTYKFRLIYPLFCNGQTKFIIIYHTRSYSHLISLVYTCIYTHAYMMCVCMYGACVSICVLIMPSIKNERNWGNALGNMKWLMKKKIKTCKFIPKSFSIYTCIYYIKRKSTSLAVKLLYKKKRKKQKK